MNVKIHPEWKELLSAEFKKPYFADLVRFVKSAYAQTTVYPAGSQIFAALDLLPPARVKVVILGQDPYHGPGQAHGLSFSVPDQVPAPPSLRNIFIELKQDLNIDTPVTGNLTYWAKQGVLLLNATLTVEKNKAGSHQKKGWEVFTDAVIKQLANNYPGLVFMLWGSYAQKKASFVDAKQHLVLTAPHPSPLSAHRGFFGCRHFSKANSFLIKNGFEPINW